MPGKLQKPFTANKFRKNEGGLVWSQRLCLSKECATSEDRRMLPVLIVNLNGAVGYWDDYKRSHYVLRPKVIDSLITLSYDFRLVAVSCES